MRQGLGVGVGLSVVLLFGVGVAEAQDTSVEEALKALGVEELEPEKAEEAEADVYYVVPGDTLWDICYRFFGDHEYWPALWSINNEEITNPHYIYPDQALRFEPGTDIRPPSVVIGGGEGLVEDLSFDESFQPIVHFLSTTQDCALHVPFSDIEDSDVTLAAPTFMTRSSIDPLGVVESAVKEAHLFAEGDVLYMRFRNMSDVNCGDIYTLYEFIKEVRHPEVRSARLGQSYRVGGEVMVTDVGDQWVTGTVVQSFGEMSRGILITDRVPVTGQVRAMQLPDRLDGFVIDKTHNENLMLQQSQVIYIDRGRADGVQSGSVFWVVRRGDGLQVRERQIDQSLPDRVIGRLVVFAADEHVSTAVLTEQAVEVEIGDRITSQID